MLFINKMDRTVKNPFHFSDVFYGLVLEIKYLFLNGCDAVEGMKIANVLTVTSTR
jgi:hypothetical protein